MAVLEAKGLSLSLAGRQNPVFSDVSVTLEAREMGFVRGAAGSGKTLLGIALCGYLPLWTGPYDLEGSIRLFEYPLEQGTEQTGAGVILENPYTQLSGLKSTIAQELAFPLESRGVPRSEMNELIDEYVERFGLRHLLARSVHTLSGGELQRVLITSTLLSGTRFLFFDRPFTEIDPETRPGILAIISDYLNESNGAALIAEDPWLIPAEPSAYELTLGEVSPWTPPRPYPYAPTPAETTAYAKEPVLEVDSLDFSYIEGSPILSDVTFSLGAGDVVFLRGANGSGKTTLARLIAGILKPTGGSIVIQGRNTASLHEWDIMCAVGVSFQNPDLHFCRKTVREECELAEKWGTPPGDLAGILGIDAMFESHPLELTQAEKKRLAIALACGGERSVLILDEPSQYQDMEGFACIEAAVRKLADDGSAVLIITHDPRFIEAFPEAGTVVLEA